MVHDESDSHFAINTESQMKRFFSLLAAVCAFTAIAAGAADSSKINGYISDTMCGAKHLGSNAACVKKCVEDGMAPVFVDEEKKAVWTIDNPGAVKAYLGAKVTVTATEDVAKKSVHIDSIAEAK